LALALLEEVLELVADGEVLVGFERLRLEELVSAGETLEVFGIDDLVVVLSEEEVLLPSVAVLQRQSRSHHLQRRFGAHFALEDLQLREPDCLSPQHVVQRHHHARVFVLKRHQAHLRPEA